MIPLAHGAGGGFDELALLAAVFLLIFGIVRLAEKQAAKRRRLMGIPMIVLALGLGSLPVVFRLGAQQMAKVRIASSAQVTIVSPQQGASVTGSFLNIVVQLRGGRIVPLASTNLKPDRGHLHISLDGRLYSMTEGLRQRIDLAGLKPGEHLLFVEFVATDHGPFAPRVTSVSTFVLEGS
jgi:hypothetical protein